MNHQLFDGALEAAIAVVLSLTARRLNLYNLAAGSWVVFGGWVGSIVVQSLKHVPSPTSPFALFLFIVPAAIQILSPLLVRRALIKNTTSYLFISLGIAIFIQKAAPAMLLKSSGATIPYSRELPALGLSGVLAVICAAVYVFRCKWWAQAVIGVRMERHDRDGWLPVAGLLCLELALLLSVGACTFFVHKGVFGSAEYRTVIPLLALIVTRGSPVRSAGLVFGAVFLGHALAGYLGAPAYSAGLAILFLLLTVGVFSWPANALLQARRSGDIDVLHRFSTLDEYAVGLVAIVALVAMALLVNLPDREGLHFALWVAGLAFVSQLAEMLLGVSSVNWPMFGTIGIYMLMLAPESMLFTGSILLGVVVLGSIYMLVVRLFSAEYALVLDIGLVVLIHDIVRNSSVAGANNVKLFASSAAGKGIFFEAMVAQVLLIILCLAVSALAVRKSSMRFYYLGLSNVRLGLQHGLHIVPVFLLISSLLLLLAIAGTLLYHTVSPTVTPAELSLEQGVMVFLFGRLARLSGPSTALIAIFTLYVLFGLILTAHGVLLGAVVGISFVILGVFPFSLKSTNVLSPAT